MQPIASSDTTTTATTTSEARSEPRRILREAHVRALVPAHDVTRYRWEQKGLFPKRIQVGPGMVGWYEDEIRAWLESRPRAEAGTRLSPNKKARRTPGDTKAR
jgi:prophage regulatory protein